MIGIICGPIWESFPVRDHLRSNLGIICGPGSFAVLRSFADPYRPVLDLFASRLNYQLPRYVSWIPDPNAVGADAFTLDWGTQYNYAFPPFSLIPEVVQKLEEDQAEIVMVALIGQLNPGFPN